MSGTGGVRIVVEAAALKRAFDQLAALGSDLTPLMRSIGAQLRQHVDERFEDERGPQGLPWPKSLRARLEKGQTLSMTGRLRQSITFRASRSAVEIGTNVQYAAVHQFGATIRAKTQKGLRFRLPGGLGWRRARQVTIPARPFLGLDAQDRAEIGHIIRRHLARAALGGGA
jgi:phage virion morphogenesis protein